MTAVIDTYQNQNPQAHQGSLNVTGIHGRPAGCVGTDLHLQCIGRGGCGRIVGHMASSWGNESKVQEAWLVARMSGN